ncbi:Rpn family recombination-promoting nuclease/putative transposase [uncultured Veillonella sp.]|uniref:Rpn family recombination-promoting nuclease/putative transposase n=1 Tax=uncultured Veillonella sp. TaxID=159268 RepID=UPI00259628D2|nr:Rpn family recombination-promoting nuclease/putative transposase [uncultured Veillonella sp.]
MNTAKYKLPTTKDCHYSRELDLDVSRFLVHDKARLYNTSQYHMPKWQDATITENFLFEKVMHNKRICKRLIEKILDITIQSIEFPEAEKSITIRRDSKSVRLDVYVTDDTGRVYDIEMQCTNPFDDELVKRTRYYQGMVDMDLIDKGMNYTELNSTYIIFICTFDLFGLGYPMYTFRNVCLEDNTLELNDGTTKLFLNSTSVIPYDSPDTFPYSNLDDDIFYFLQYINGHAPQGKFVNEIDTEVGKVKESKEMEKSYMTYAMEIERHRREAKNIGIAIGREEGLKQGQAAGSQLRAQKIALSMLREQIPLNVIVKCTSLSEQEIRTLAKEHNLL